MAFKAFKVKKKRKVINISEDDFKEMHKLKKVLKLPTMTRLFRFILRRVLRCFRTHGRYTEPFTVRYAQSTPTLASRQAGFFANVTPFGVQKKRKRVREDDETPIKSANCDLQVIGDSTPVWKRRHGDGHIGQHEEIQQSPTAAVIHWSPCMDGLHVLPQHDDGGMSASELQPVDHTYHGVGYELRRKWISSSTRTVSPDHDEHTVLSEDAEMVIVDSVVNISADCIQLDCIPDGDVLRNNVDDEFVTCPSVIDGVICPNVSDCNNNVIDGVTCPNVSDCVTCPSVRDNAMPVNDSVENIGNVFGDCSVDSHSDNVLHSCDSNRSMHAASPISDVLPMSECNRTPDMLNKVLGELNIGANDKSTASYYLVSKASLHQLLTVCRVPGCVSEVVFEKEIVTGSCYKVRMRCTQGHVRTWSSSPEIHDARDSMFSEVNVALCAAIFLSGNNFDKIERLFRCLSVPLVCGVTFRDLCKSHMYPVVSEWWKGMQNVIFNDLGDEPVALCGDGRADSPGFSAQFCLYSFVAKNLVVHAELVDKRETNFKSTNMEKLACLRGLLYLLEHVNISHFCTDAHTQIRAMMSKDARLSNIIHQFDIFHKSVKLHTKLLEAANVKGNAALLEFVSGVRNHFWHCAETCGGDVDKLIEKWVSVLRHVIGEHCWQDGECDHPPLPADAKMLDPESLAMDALRSIVLDKKLLQDMHYFKNFMHTFSLESFHNELLVYLSKRIAFGYEGTKARCLLAILDHNFHCDRLPKLNMKGEVQYTRKWSKRSKHWVSVTKKQEKSFAFLPYIMRSVMKSRSNAVKSYKVQAHAQLLPDGHPKTISKNLAECPAPSSRELAAQHQTRFLKVKK